MTATLEERVFCETINPTLHHVSLFVRDMEASVKFYTAGLGLTVREEYDDIIGLGPSHKFPFGVASVFLECGVGRYVELHPAGDSEMSQPGFPMNHLAFAVADVDAAYDQAIASGAVPFGFALPSEDWDGTPLDVVMSGQNAEPMRMAFLQGPSNELIELYQHSPTNAI